MTKKNLLIFILSFSYFVCYAQKAKKLENVKGEWVVSRDITLAQARENALNQAKTEALREAGVPEYVFSSNVLFRKEELNNNQDVFQSLTSVDVSGEISEYSIVKEEKTLNTQNEILVQIWINAAVIIHKHEKDPGFKIDVGGVREKYINSELLTFNVKPWKEGYLTIFIMSEKECSKLYPNAYEPQALLKGEVDYTFPKSKLIDYELNTDEKIEINYLLLLFTKQEMPFMEEENSDNVLRFIAQINPANKYLVTQSFVIKNE